MPRRAVLALLAIGGGTAVMTLLAWNLLMVSQALRDGTRLSVASFGLSAIRRSLEADLSVVRGEALFEEHSRLKLYLMLGDPERLDVRWATGQVVAESTPAVRGWLGCLKDRELAALELDEQLVERVRATLQGVPFDVRLEALLIRSIDAERVDPSADVTAENLAFPPMSLPTLIRAHPEAEPYLRSRQGAHHSESLTVRGVYTAAGKDAFVSGLRTIEDLLDEDAWVGTLRLDAGKKRKLPAIVTRLVTTRYGPDYAKSWDAFLADLYVEPPGTTDAALELYGMLAAHDGPIPMLIAVLERETLWKAPPSEPAPASRKYLGSYHPPPMLLDSRSIHRELVRSVPDRFRPVLDCMTSSYATQRGEPRIASYQRIVRLLRDAIATAKKANPGVELRSLDAPITSAHTEAEALLAGCHEHARAVWTPLLVQPLKPSDDAHAREGPR